MNPRSRLNLVLAIVWVALTGFVLIVEKPFAARPERYVQYGKLFPKFVPELVHELQIRRQVKDSDEVNEVRCVRNDAPPTGWIVKTLYDHPADFQKINEVVARVQNWTDDQPVGMTDEKHEKMAVDDTEGTYCVLRDRDGGALAEFFVGRIGGFDAKRLPAGGKIEPEDITFYLRPLPGNRVYRIREFLLGTFTHQSEHWAAKKLFDLEEESITSIAVAWEDGGYVLQKVGDEWRPDGLAFPLDPNATRQVASSIQHLSGVDVVDPERPLSDWGLDAPSRSVTITLRDGSQGRVVFGAATEDEKQIYGKDVTSRYTMKFTASIFDRIFQDKDEFRKRALFEFNAHEATRIVLDHGDETVVLTKHEDPTTKRPTWRIDEPEERATDPAAINPFVSAIGRLQLDAYVEQGGEPARYGLDAPAFRLVAELPTATHTLLVGGTDDDGRHLAMAEGAGWVVALTDEELAKVRLRFADLREKTPEELEAIAAERQKEIERKAAEAKKAEEEAAAPDPESDGETPKAPAPDPEDPAPEGDEPGTPPPPLPETPGDGG